LNEKEIRRRVVGSKVYVAPHRQITQHPNKLHHGTAARKHKVGCYEGTVGRDSHIGHVS
jgi:hypothetical protein